jgi:hypothetical protein
MSNLKDTDFDDLFRRASDKYPLRTDSSDWDRMAAALERDPSPDAPDETDNTDKRRRRRFFWLFLLLPLAGIGYYVTHSSAKTGNGINTTAVAKSNPAIGATASPSTGANTTAGTNPNVPATASTTATKPTTTPAKSTGGNNSVDNSIADKNAANNIVVIKKAGNNKTVGNNATANKVTTTSPNTLATSGGQAGAGMPLTAPRMGHNNDLKNKRKPIRRAEGDFPVRPDVASANSNPKENNRFADKNEIDPTTNPITASFTLKNANVNEQRARTAGAYNVNVDVKAPPIAKDTTKKKEKKKQDHYLYAGIIAAPDLSTVKMQKTKGVGDTYGVLIGYAFNEHWSVETGAYLDRKRYYTAGEYFNTSKVSFNPNYDKLLNVDGTCYMWEIPLNVRYNINPSGKTRWFATAGASTYLMNREKYNATVEYINGNRPWNAAWDLKKSSQYPFSVIGFSFGFEQRLGKVGNLRVEPYARIPLGGIGTGSLPILSTGINIGITRRLW